MQVGEIYPRESLESEMSRWERTEPWRTPSAVGRQEACMKKRKSTLWFVQFKILKEDLGRGEKCLVVDLESQMKDTDKAGFNGGSKHQAWLQKGVPRGML